MSRIIRVACAWTMAGAFVGATNAADEITHDAAEGYPDHIIARLELQSRAAQRLPAIIGREPLEFVITDLKRWEPGQTITIAIRGGGRALHDDIAGQAKAWTDVANVKFDFGVDANGQYRTWNPTDRTYAADIRISFDAPGRWSLVGSDSVDMAIVTPGEASMNFGRFIEARPGDWKGTVIHEFGHALGFQHEHQHPSMGCDSEFRFEDDPGYVQTRDGSGQFIADSMGRRPGIYTVLGGPPNNWPRFRVDHNLRQLRDEHAFIVGPFDRDSIMKYQFPEWMFVRGDQSPCFSPRRNDRLSPRDIEGAKRAYPADPNALANLLKNRKAMLLEVIEARDAAPSIKTRFETQLEALRAPE